MDRKSICITRETHALIKRISLEEDKHIHIVVAEAMLQYIKEYKGGKYASYEDQYRQGSV